MKTSVKLFPNIDHKISFLQVDFKDRDLCTIQSCTGVFTRVYFRC